MSKVALLLLSFVAKIGDYLNCKEILIKTGSTSHCKIKPENYCK